MMAFHWNITQSKKKKKKTTHNFFLGGWASNTLFNITFVAPMTHLGTKRQKQKFGRRNFFFFFLFFFEVWKWKIACAKIKHVFLMDFLRIEMLTLLTDISFISKGKYQGIFWHTISYFYPLFLTVQLQRLSKALKLGHKALNWDNTTFFTYIFVLNVASLLCLDFTTFDYPSLPNTGLFFIWPLLFFMCYQLNQQELQHIFHRIPQFSSEAFQKYTFRLLTLEYFFLECYIHTIYKSGEILTQHLLSFLQLYHKVGAFCHPSFRTHFLNWDKKSLSQFKIVSLINS